jgi:hypothetical protein
MVKNFVDENLYMHADKDKESENPLTFSALYADLTGTTPPDYAHFYCFLKKNPSHDEITGAIALWEIRGLNPKDFHERYWSIVWRNYYHGVLFFADMIFYFAWLGRPWARMLMIFPAIQTALSALPLPKFSPDLVTHFTYALRYKKVAHEWSWVTVDGKRHDVKLAKSYETPEGFKGATYHRLKLDGVQLAFLRFRAVLMPKTKAIFNWILRLRFGERARYVVHYAYFLSDRHPIVIAARGLFGAS